MYPLATADADVDMAVDARVETQKDFDVDAAIRRFDEIPSLNRARTVAQPRIAKGTLVPQRLEPLQTRPRCVLPQEVDVRAVLDAIRRAR